MCDDHNNFFKYGTVFKLVSEPAPHSILNLFFGFGSGQNFLIRNATNGYRYKFVSDDFTVLDMTGYNLLQLVPVPVLLRNSKKCVQ
jgi:hypothetical protein